MPEGSSGGVYLDPDIRGGKATNLRDLQAHQATLAGIKFSKEGIAFPDGTIQASAPSSQAIVIPGRNKLVNGALDIAQLGPTQALTTAPVYGSMDNWWAMQATAAAGALTQAASPIPGFAYVAKLGRTAGSGNLGVISMGQPLQMVDSVRFALRRACMSFYAFAGANFSAAGGKLVSTIDTGTTGDQSSLLQSASGWGGHIANNQANTLYGTWRRYTHFLDVPANAKQLGVRFSYTPTGVAGADDNFYVTGIQLAIESEVSDFEDRSAHYERLLARHWLRVWVIAAGGFLASTSGLATAGNTWLATGLGDNVADMRVPPAIVMSGFGTFAVLNAAGVAVPVTALTVPGAVSGSIIYAAGNVAAGLVAGDATALISAAAVPAVVAATAQL